MEFFDNNTAPSSSDGADSQQPPTLPINISNNTHTSPPTPTLTLTPALSMSIDSLASDVPYQLPPPLPPAPPTLPLPITPPLSSSLTPSSTPTGSMAGSGAGYGSGGGGGTTTGSMSDSMADLDLLTSSSAATVEDEIAFILDSVADLDVSYPFLDSLGAPEPLHLHPTSRVAPPHRPCSTTVRPQKLMKRSGSTPCALCGKDEGAAVAVGRPSKVSQTVLLQTRVLDAGYAAFYDAHFAASCLGQTQHHCRAKVTELADSVGVALYRDKYRTRCVPVAVMQAYDGSQPIHANCGSAYRWFLKCMVEVLAHHTATV